MVGVHHTSHGWNMSPPNNHCFMRCWRAWDSVLLICLCRSGCLSSAASLALHALTRAHTDPLARTHGTRSSALSVGGPRAMSLDRLQSPEPLMCKQSKAKQTDRGHMHVGRFLRLLHGRSTLGKYMVRSQHAVAFPGLCPDCIERNACVWREGMA